MNIIAKYRASIRRNCTNAKNNDRQVIYWRNELFANTIISLLPLCLIALIPALWWSYKNGLYQIALVDMVATCSMLFIAFWPGLMLSFRKVLFISCTYFLAFAMLYYVNVKGPGLIYLLVACIFSVLIFSNNNSWWPAWVNSIICMLYALVIYFKLGPTPKGSEILIGEWIAISTNLIFLSFLCVSLIPKLFNSLQTTIDREIGWQAELTKEKKALADAMLSLHQKNKELEEFAFIASHDLQEPLRMITSFLTQLERKLGDNIDEKSKQYIHFAVDGSQRMRRIILDLLEYSRAGKIEKQAELVDFNELLSEVIEVFSKEIKTKGAQIIVGTLPVIETHRNLIYQVFQNLIGNALKYSIEFNNPQIQIACREFDTHWEFSCIDNGIGIDPDYFNKIFIIFQRLHDQKSYSGSGIGLAITKKIVEFLGGEIWVDSSLGKGSVFSFTILKKNINNG